MKKLVPGGRKEGRHELFMPKNIGKIASRRDGAVLTAGLQGKKACCERCMIRQSNKEFCRNKEGLAYEKKFKGGQI